MNARTRQALMAEAIAETLSVKAEQPSVTDFEANQVAADRVLVAVFEAESIWAEEQRLGF